MFKKNTEIIRILANTFHIIYGIKYLEESSSNSFVSKYKYSDEISTIIVSISAKKGLFIVKNKNENI